MHVDLLEALRSRGVTVTDATPALTGVFDRPYEEEVPIIEWLSVTTSRVIEAAAEVLRPGMRENELAAIIDKTLEEGIVERWFATIVASGPRAAAPHAKTSTRRIEYGDPVVIDVGPYWMGYDGCVAHTLVVGRSEYWEGVVEKVLEALKAGLDIVRPGTPVKELDEVPRRVLAEASLPNYPHLSGHPVGGFYKPVIASFLDYGLERNMVFAYEPATYISGKGGARIEPHILVITAAHRILTPIHEGLLR